MASLLSKVALCECLLRPSTRGSAHLIFPKLLKLLSSRAAHFDQHGQIWERLCFLESDESCLYMICLQGDHGGNTLR
ncbi:hypothetical protein CBR_g3539 [Chara braunii]|uniref:Uncharacterized protein n=1 Tax=Chara braunii TaxID=69332 RepID=A0A388KFL5_CHABU|nr:hypothetical protein CBR_g3539 [Chara braunii]|eukprot:GBG68845.1 hypothetical protein CBR_g3539 [Chara braunii]